MTVTIGVRSRLISPIERAIASAMPRSSDSAPGMGARARRRRSRSAARSARPAPSPASPCGSPRVRHPEVAPDVLVGVGALLLADDHDPPAVDPGEAGDDRGVVAEQPVAVELDEVVGHLRRRSSRVRGRRRLRASWTRAQTASRGSAAPAVAPSAGRGATASSSARPISPTSLDERAEERERAEPVEVDLDRGGAPAAGSPGPRRAAAGAGGRARRAAPARGTTRSTKPCSNRNSERWKPGRQLLGDRPGRDARAGEPDEGVRLGDVDVADGRRTRRRRRRSSGRDRTLRNGTPASRRRSSAASVLASCIRARVPSCIRAPPDAQTMISGDPGVERVLGGPGHLLADDRAHRAAHEPEVHDADRDRRAVDASPCPRPRRRAARSPSGRRRAGPGTASGRRTRAGRPTGGRRRAPSSVPGSRSSSRRAAADSRKWWPQVGQTRSCLVELLVEQHLLAGRALRPQVRRVGVAAGAERGQLDRHQASLVRGDGADRSGHRAARARAGSARRRRPRRRATGRPRSSAPPISSGRPMRRRESRAAGCGSIRPRRPRPGGEPGTAGRRERDDRALAAGGERQAHPRRRPRRAGRRGASSNRNDGWKRGRSRARRSAAAPDAAGRPRGAPAPGRRRRHGRAPPGAIRGSGR